LTSNKNQQDERNQEVNKKLTKSNTRMAKPQIPQKSTKKQYGQKENE
jgi:hypothetical protein